ncbi:MAG: hypothetical protein AB7O68_16225 [Pirellulales bacterium]
MRRTAAISTATAAIAATTAATATPPTATGKSRRRIEALSNDNQQDQSNGVEASHGQLPGEAIAGSK